MSTIDWTAIDYSKPIDFQQASVDRFNNNYNKVKATIPVYKTDAERDRAEKRAEREELRRAEFYAEHPELKSPEQTEYERLTKLENDLKKIKKILTVGNIFKGVGTLGLNIGAGIAAPNVMLPIWSAEAAAALSDPKTGIKRTISLFNGIDPEDDSFKNYLKKTGEIESKPYVGKGLLSAAGDALDVAVMIPGAAQISKYGSEAFNYLKYLNALRKNKSRLIEARPIFEQSSLLLRQPTRVELFKQSPYIEDVVAEADPLLLKAPFLSEVERAIVTGGKAGVEKEFPQYKVFAEYVPKNKHIAKKYLDYLRQNEERLTNSTNKERDLKKVTNEFWNKYNKEKPAKTPMSKDDEWGRRAGIRIEDFEDPEVYKQILDAQYSQYLKEFEKKNGIMGKDYWRTVIRDVNGRAIIEKTGGQLNYLKLF